MTNTVRLHRVLATKPVFSEETRRSHEYGWCGALDKLVRHLQAPEEGRVASAPIRRLERSLR